jgi:acyl-CoA reductase-like NAD-dependent aldehyde dehydrogenase
MVQGAAVMTDRMGERAEMRSAVQVFTDRHPLGVCLMVTPFNLPFLVPLWYVCFHT